MSDLPNIVLINEENVLKSWAKDFVTFGGLVATAWFVNAYCNSSGWLNFTVSIAWILWVFGRAQRHKHQMAPAELREWLDENYPLQSKDNFQ